MSSGSFGSFGEWVGRNLLFSDVLESDTRVPKLPQIDWRRPWRHQVWVARTENRVLDCPGHGERAIDYFRKQSLLILLFSFEDAVPLYKVLIMGAAFALCLSCIIYRFIVLPRKHMHTLKDKHSIDSGMTLFLIGFGLIMPICAILPYYLMRYFKIRNKIIKFLAASVQLTFFFRCSEGESPVRRYR